MKEIKFRYIVKFVDRMKNGEVISERIESNIFGIEAIEDDGLDESLAKWLYSELGMGYGTCEILARQQHTGLKDSEGNEIYEGDILDSHMGPLEVMFVDGAFIAKMKEQPGKWGYHIGGASFNQCPIIGNLYQNSELLNEPQNTNSGTD